MRQFDTRFTDSEEVKIVIVSESFLPQLNGVTNSVIRVARHQRDRGHDVSIVAPTRPGQEFEGIPVHVVPSIPLVKFAVGIPSLALTNLLDRIDPDIIHVASPFALGAQAIAYAQRHSIASVAVYQTDIAGYLHRYGMAVAKPMVDRFVANTHNAATVTLAPTPIARDALAELGVKNLAVWGRGVDLDCFHPNTRFAADAVAFRQKHAPNGERIIGYVGRLAAEKQVDRFRELVGLPNTRILLTGDGPERARLQALFPTDSITFLGSRSGRELQIAYAAMDVFVHFGVEETFGQTIQEAQAAGVPVVAPQSGGPIHLIDSGVDGILFDINSPDSPRTAVQFLIDDAELRSRMGEAGRRRVLGKSWEAVNDELTHHYDVARSRTNRRALA
jgi:phosphatidylinositol alpha 1,6-mannosyltransferase